MRPAFGRRRFVTIAAAAAVLPVASGASGDAIRWHGTALGADASITLAGLGESDATAVFRRVEAELERLDRIFSLYRRDSQLVALNRDGRLAAPAPELIDLCGTVNAVHDATRSAFDPTIQPLWSLHARAASAGRAPGRRELAEARSRIGWKHVDYRQGEICFARSGMALSFNGIAQGYITDRIAALLRDIGLSSVLIDIGEIAALGQKPDGRSWQAGIAGHDGRVIRHIALTDRALATSVPFGTVIDPVRGIGHIFTPVAGEPETVWEQVSVSAPDATRADAFSTAFCILSGDRIDAVLSTSAARGIRIEHLV